MGAPRLLVISYSVAPFHINFSGRFDTSGSMIPLLVPEILPCDGFCDEQEHQEQQQELDILGV